MDHLQPGTLCRIVWASRCWACALNRIVTITGFELSTKIYTFEPEVTNGFRQSTCRGERRCFQPISDPDSCNTTEKDIYRDKVQVL